MEKYQKIIEYSKENNELTKSSLKDGLIQLLKNNRFKDITVSKLCLKAGVSRMSFYRNYSILDDIFKEIAIDLNVDIIKRSGSPFRNGTHINWYINTFNRIVEIKDEYMLLSQHEFQEEWMRVVNNLAIKKETPNKEKYYQRLMWCGGFENVCSNWINNGMQESVEEISEYCLKYLPHLLKREDK